MKTLQKRLGYEFKNLDLITEALTHKSYKKPYNNERLEFLGDAVLDLIIGEYLFKKFPNVAEGDLSKMRASIVNEKGFEKLALKIGLDKCIFISIAEENNNGRKKPSILSDAFEALIGAIYLESDLKNIQKIVIKLLEDCYDEINLNQLNKDYKTLLQELTQAHFGVIPNYETIKAFGPDHKKIFEIEVKICNKSYGKAKGTSKKEAQQNAAKITLEKLKDLR